MAFASTTEWDVRTTGSDANGGAFDTAASGTDYSQQAAAQVVYTDLVIGATTTHLTSALNPFTSAHVGNLINITGGTGFTVQRVQVVSVAAGVATCDRSAGTGASTGGTGNLGGAIQTIPGINTAASQPGAGNTKAWIRSGTYTLTVVTVAAPGSGVSIYEGYGTTHGDFGTAPLITTATNATSLFSSGLTLTFINCAFSNTAGTRAVGFYPTLSSVGITFDRSTLSGFTDAINGDNAGIHFIFTCVDLVDSEISACSAHAITNNFRVRILNSYIHGITGAAAVTAGSGFGEITLVRAIIANNSGSGVQAGGGAVVSIPVFALNSDIYANGGSGIEGAASLENCIIYGNSRYGVDGALVIDRLNAFGVNTLGNLNPAAALSPSDFVLASTPFTGAADFSLNAGAGAPLKGAGYPGIFPGGVGTSALDIGAIQTPAAAATLGNVAY